VEAIKKGDTRYIPASEHVSSPSNEANAYAENIINVSGENKYIIPENAQTLIALGAALSLDTTLGNKKQNPVTIEKILKVFENETPTTKTLGSEKTVRFFENEDDFAKFNERYNIEAFSPKVYNRGEKVSVFVGIDAGSTTTKFVAIDENKEVIYSFYKNNSGKPIDTAKDGLLEFGNHYKNQGVEIEIKGLGTTGYGEILFAKAFGADFHIVETIAHKAAAHFYEPDVSFILDLGGQDMKAIFINNGIITNIALNEACSAGCGSFIESYSKSLKIAPQDIAKLAFDAKNPSSLGSRCTVFMNSSIITEQKSGKTVGDILAGLCVSVIENLFTKVVRISTPSILGEHIVVQGGTFKNDAVLRAFTQYIGREVIRPRFSGEMGALGVALLTMEEMRK
jgi:predicted CoA-substrate-specific enzyme activase